MNHRGVTVMELLVTTSIVATVLTLGILSWRAFQDSMRMTMASRAIIQALHTARTLAIESGQPTRAYWDGQAMLVQESGEPGWRTRSTFQPDPRVTVRANATPIFFRSGLAAPLCTIELRGVRCDCRITLSIAGRIRTCRTSR